MKFVFEKKKNIKRRKKEKNIKYEKNVFGH